MIRKIEPNKKPVPNFSDTEAFDFYDFEKYDRIPFSEAHSITNMKIYWGSITINNVATTVINLPPFLTQKFPLLSECIVFELLIQLGQPIIITNE